MEAAQRLALAFWTLHSNNLLRRRVRVLRLLLSLCAERART